MRYREIRMFAQSYTKIITFENVKTSLLML
jgi:hypothetical protein